MKFAGRINSLIFKNGASVLDTIDQYKKIEGITHLEFNYPEHILPGTIDDIKRHAGELHINGVATRFRSEFNAGEFTNTDEKIVRSAIQLCKNAVDACRALGGEVVTVWEAFDGFEYPFQLDYEKKWNRIIESLREITDYAGDIKVSLEYKPYEPRAYAMLDSIGLTLLAVREVSRKNIGVTLDFCHMLMKHDCPAFGLALAARNKQLFGLHMNDGYRNMDNGMIFGSVNPPQALEFVYYLKKYAYDGVVFFDTFPVREDPSKEILENMTMFRAMDAAIDRVGMDEIAEVVKKQDGVCSQQLIHRLLRNM